MILLPPPPLRFNLGGIKHVIFGGDLDHHHQNGKGLLEEEYRSVIPVECYRKALDVIDNEGNETVSLPVSLSVSL